MSADLHYLPTNPKPSAKEAMDAPINDEARTLQRLTTEVAVAQIKWWRGWGQAFERFWSMWWLR